MVAQTLLYVSAALELFLLARLRQLGLRRRPFRAFLMMVTTDLIFSFVLMIPGFRTHTYTVLWELTVPIALLTRSLAGISTYQAIAELYPSIGRFAVWLYTSSLSITGVACLFGLPFETRRIGGSEATLRTLFLLYRWTHTLLAGGLVLAVVFLSRFPKPLKQMPSNLLLHTRLLCVYFCLYAIKPFILNLVPLGRANSVENIQLFCVLVLYVAWFFGLTKEGQQTEPWPQVSSETLNEIEAQNSAAMDLAQRAARDALNQAAGRK